MDFAMEIRNEMSVGIITPPRSSFGVPPEKWSEEKAVGRVMAIFMDSLNPNCSDYAYDILQARLRKLFLHIRRDAETAAAFAELPMDGYDEKIRKCMQGFFINISEEKSEGWRLQTKGLLEQFCGEFYNNCKEANKCSYCTR